jgi:hypothetical protein
MEDPPSIPTAAMTGASEPDGSPTNAQLPRTFLPQQEVKPPSLQGGHGRWRSRQTGALLLKKWS